MPQTKTQYTNVFCRNPMSRSQMRIVTPEYQNGTDPTRASKEKGERMWELMIRHLVEFVEDLKNLSLSEIYERNY